MTCAADGTGSDGCGGDSGSPLTHSHNGVRTIYGMNSWSDVPCAQNNKPGVYARVTAVLDWIEHKAGVKPAGSTAPVSGCVEDATTGLQTVDDGGDDGDDDDATTQEPVTTEAPSTTQAPVTDEDYCD